LRDSRLFVMRKITYQAIKVRTVNGKAIARYILRPFIWKSCLPSSNLKISVLIKV
jgi:hypothetical protein